MLMDCEESLIRFSPATHPEGIGAKALRHAASSFFTRVSLNSITKLIGLRNFHWRAKSSRLTSEVVTRKSFQFT